MKTLKEIRKEKRLTQEQAAKLLKVSVRSYKSYENEKEKTGTLKYNYLHETLSAYNPIDEEHGILSLEEIEQICKSVFENYAISFCYLFGSYAKKTAREDSDIDLLIDTTVTGLRYYALVEDLRVALKKKVDVLDLKQLNQNDELLREVLKDGIKIYG